MRRLLSAVIDGAIILTLAASAPGAAVHLAAWWAYDVREQRQRQPYAGPRA